MPILLADEVGTLSLTHPVEQLSEKLYRDRPKKVTKVS